MLLQNRPGQAWPSLNGASRQGSIKHPDHWPCENNLSRQKYSQDLAQCPVLLLAQLVAPPIQPGPVRLPAETAPQERQTQPADQPVLQPTLKPAPEDADELPTSGGAPALIPSWRPTVIGDSPYSKEEIEAVLKRCGKATPAKTLRACAAALTARFIKDGYVNTRVYTLPKPYPGALEVVMGVIAELQVESSDPELKAKVEKQLSPLLGSVLHIPTLEKALVEVRRGGVGKINGNMGRLGSDPTKAVVTLGVEAAPPTPLRGDFSIGNNGSPGNGEWRSNAVLLQNDFLKRGDTALLFFELKNDGQLELGSTLLSATYTYPLSDRWNLTGSIGYSHSNFVEFIGDPHKLNFRTLQGLIQVDTVFHQGRGLSWTGAAGISASRTDSFEGNASVPLVVGGGEDGWMRSGNVKLSTTVSGITGPAGWSANGYFLQGFPGLTNDEHLHNLDRLGIDVGEARAMGGLANLTLLAAPNVIFNLRGAGQVAFSSLPSSMGFSLGSDVGLIGLPGSIASGDSGWLAIGELIWTVWKNDKQQLQLIPYVGKGGIHTEIDDVTFDDQVGSGGLIARYTHGRWQVELGWVNTFETNDNPGIWNDWWLGNGIHTKLRYAF